MQEVRKQLQEKETWGEEFRLKSFKLEDDLEAANQKLVEAGQRLAKKNEIIEDFERKIGKLDLQ